MPSVFSFYPTRRSHTFNPGRRFFTIPLQPLIRVVDADFSMFSTLVYVDMIALSGLRVRVGLPRRRRVPCSGHPGQLLGWETNKRQSEKEDHSYSAAGDRSPCTKQMKQHSTLPSKRQRCVFGFGLRERHLCWHGHRLVDGMYQDGLRYDHIFDASQVALLSRRILLKLEWRRAQSQ